MKNLIFIILIGLVIGCNTSGNKSKEALEKEFEEKFSEELKEIDELEKSGEWKHAEPAGDELQCPCCDYFTLGKRGDYDICPVCFWEDDGLDIDKLDEHSWPNHITLREGRQNFLKFGACDSSMVENVLDKSQREKFRFESRNVK